MMTKVFEVDGPPKAYFTDSNGNHVFRLVILRGKDARTVLRMLHDAIQYLTTVAARENADTTLVWRKRPHLEEDMTAISEPTGFVRARCRLVFVPPIPEWAWKEVESLVGFVSPIVGECNDDK